MTVSMKESVWKTFVRMIASTQSDEIGCGECFAELDRFD